MNPYLIIPVTAIFINSILITYVIGVGIKTEITKAFILFVFSMTLWEMGEIFLLAQSSPHTCALFLKMSAPLYLSPGFLFFNFVQKLSNKKNGYIYYFFLLSFVIAVITVVFTDLFTLNEITFFNWGVVATPGLLYFPIIILVILVPAFYSIFILSFTQLKSDEVLYKRQLNIVIAGFFIVIIAGIVTNIILPFMLKNYDFPLAASSILSIQSIFMFVGIIKYNFLTPTIKDFAFNLFSQINDGVVAVDRSGVIIEINTPALNMMSQIRESAIGKHYSEVFPFEYDFDVNFSNKEVHYGIDGKMYYILYTQISLSRSEYFLGKLIVIKDITDQIRFEEELVKASKIESLGILAGGIAHDFNNMLTVIVGNISLAKMEEADSAKRNLILENAEKASLRAKNLTNQLLTFSKGGGPVKKIISTKTILENTAQLVLSGSANKLSMNISPDLFDVNADETQITQVLHNIIINSVQSMVTGGIIQIEAENVLISKKEMASLSEGDYVKISVKDQGEGILEKDLPFIFDPFFTTKKNGTGLGLAISYSVIKRHGGLITVMSKPQQGSTFAIYLPADRDKADAPQEITFYKANKSGRILLMDDEPGVLNVGVKLLQKLGYETVTSTNGADAISIFKNEFESNRTFDCIILDLTIPGGLGGKETIQKLLDIDPTVVAVVSSGYCNDPIMAGYKDYGFSGVLSKPFTFEELQQILFTIENTKI